MHRYLFLLVAMSSLSWAEVDFAHEIVPILRERCSECHTGDKKKGGLSMNSRRDLLAGGEDGEIVALGKSSESELIKRVLSVDPDFQMPPKGPRLTAEEVGKLKAWIDANLPWEDGFAFKKPAYEPALKPRRPELPPAQNGREHPIDRILDAEMTKRGAPRPAPLADAAFLRRVQLDLIGLLPEPEKLADFLADNSTDKRERAVQALLANDLAYAEHWLTFWNDLLRNDYAGTGYIDGGRKQISDWLYQALIENKPYDQFVRELIAPSSPDSEGFGRGIKWRGTVSAGQAVPVQFAQSIGQSFLGLNLKCASCHDSFVDRWKLEEAYGLAAIFAEQPLELHRCDKPMGKQAKPAWLFPEIGQVDGSKPRAERLKQLAVLMTHPENGRFTRTIVNRLWHRLMGRGIVHPVDAMQSEPWNEDLLDMLAMHLADNGYDLKKSLAFICASQAYQSKSEIVSEVDEAHYHYAGPRPKRMSAEQFVDAIWLITGTAPTKFDAPLKRGKPMQSKMELTGRWIWNSDNQGSLPAAGETIALRREISLKEKPVKASLAISCDNSYQLFINGQKMGAGEDWQKPDGWDPRDFLKVGANEFLVVAKNAGTGPNHAGLYLEGRLRFSDDSEQSFATNKDWQWSARLPNAEGKFPEPASDWKPAVEVTPEGWTERVGREISARLASEFNEPAEMVRASLLKNDLLMRALGRPNREQIVSMRPNNLTTLEAMDLNNGQILNERLESGARHLLTKPWANSATLVDWLYRFALSRSPTSQEQALAVEVIGPKPNEQGLQDLLWSLVMLPEFQFVR